MIDGVMTAFLASENTGWIYGGGRYMGVPAGSDDWVIHGLLG